MLDPTGYVAANPQPQYVCGVEPSKMWFKNVLIQLMLNKDRYTAKPIKPFKKINYVMLMLISKVTVPNNLTGLTAHTWIIFYLHSQGYYSLFSVVQK
jgi:hypothetical protein